MNYPQPLMQSCGCKTVIENMRVVDELPLLNDKYRSTVKLYIKSPSGKIKTQRGFIEYEADELTQQDARILNQNNEEVCRGSLTFSLGDGSFDLSCFNGAIKARGIIELAGLFSKKHAVGSAVLDDGDVFAFVSGLNDGEIEDKYPGFPDRTKPETNSVNESGGR